MDLEFWATTDVGRVRDHNEDNFLVDKRLKLFVVCDGMGGHAAGEVASAMGVQIVREVVSSHREVFDALEADSESLANRKSVLKLLEHAIEEACARIFHEAQEDSAKRGMGTTCSALLLAHGRAFIGHVGDSRIYLFRQEKIHQITEDHSLINEMIRLGKIKPGEEHHLPHKNAVTRAVGVNEHVEVDTFELDVQGGDSFLVCSDGLSGYFKHDDHIIDLMELEEPRKITERSIEFANAGGGKDNITSIVVRVREDASQQHDIQATIELLKSTPYFQYLAYKETLKVVNVTRRMEFEAGDRIVEAEKDPEGMFVIVSGKVRVMRGGRGVATLLPGDALAEICLVDDTPPNYGAEAVEDSSVIFFSRTRFMELLRGDPNVAVKLLWNFLQTFSYRMRGVPYEALLGDRAEGPGEHTPPSGNLVFSEDRKKAEGHQPSSVSGEFLSPPTGAMTIDPSAVDTVRSTTNDDVATKRTKPVSPRTRHGDALATNGAKPSATARPRAAAALNASPSEPAPAPPKAVADPSARVEDTVPNERDAKIRRALRDTVADMELSDPDSTMGDEDLRSAAMDTIPAGSAFLADEMAWDKIVPSDILEDEASLRQTAQMDHEPDDKARTHAALDRTVSKERSNAPNGIGKPISGTSVVRDSTPQAQVLKRTKLIVADDHNADKGFNDRERTRDVPNISQKESDSTLELDVVDENVEEVP